MIASQDAPKTLFQKHGRIVMVLVVVSTLLSAATTFFFYKRYADVWLRHHPRPPPCATVAARLLSHDENVSGSIPHMAPDGNMVYLRPAEDRAVRCMSRLSSSTAAVLAAAFAEVDPDKRARALAAILPEHVSKQPSADVEAIVVYAITMAAMGSLPKTPEVKDLRNQVNIVNACRFDMRTPCPTRPPLPIPVWIFGALSSIGLVVSFGWGGKSIATRVRAWWDKRKLAKTKTPKLPSKTNKTHKTTESEKTSES